MNKSQTALVLQGGGALGAYEAGVIKRLYEIPGFSLDVVSGVSIGAINAAVLVGARGDPVTTLEAMWEDFTVVSPSLMPDVAEAFIALLGNQSFYRPRLDYYRLPFWTSLYDTAPLRTTLERYVDFRHLNRAATQVVVTAANIRTGAIEVFDNSHPNSPLEADHVLASGSLPPGFPMTKLGDETYWDGGLFDNTPLAPVIERLEPDPEVRKRLFVVELFPSAGRVPRHLLQVLDRILEMVFASRLSRDLTNMLRINEYVEVVEAVEALLDSVGGPQAERVRALPGFQRLRRYMAVQDVISVQNQDPEVVFGPFDFSRARIQRRIEAGYRDADRTLASI